MQKEKYKRIEMEVIEFGTEDILSTSNDEYEGWNPGSNGGGGYEGWNPGGTGGSGYEGWQP